MLSRVAKVEKHRAVGVFKHWFAVAGNAKRYGARADSKITGKNTPHTGVRGDITAL
jgi:hypothetical protein